MAHLIKTSYFGRLVYKASNYKYFNCPEEQQDYEIPKEYFNKDQQIIIDWGQSDPEHPRNWSFLQRIVVQLQVSLFTFSMYVGGPIYTPAIPTIEQEFNTSYVKSTLPLSVYILGYGFTQIVFPAMSEQ